jgi:hypothetical protein
MLVPVREAISSRKTASPKAGGLSQQRAEVEEGGFGKQAEFSMISQDCSNRLSSIFAYRIPANGFSTH